MKSEVSVVLLEVLGIEGGRAGMGIVDGKVVLLGLVLVDILD